MIIVDVIIETLRWMNYIGLKGKAVCWDIKKSIPDYMWNPKINFRDLVLSITLEVWTFKLGFNRVVNVEAFEPIFKIGQLAALNEWGTSPDSLGAFTACNIKWYGTDSVVNHFFE